jgi:hypothetical protein
MRCPVKPPMIIKNLWAQSLFARHTEAHQLQPIKTTPAVKAPITVQRLVNANPSQNSPSVAGSQ